MKSSTGERRMLSVPCKRCGIIRRMQAGESPRPLCRDCKFVLSKEDAAAWV